MKYLTIILLALIVEVKSYSQTSIYISQDGNDAYPGTISQPLKTIDRAIELIKNEYRNPKDTMTIYLRKGIFNLTDPITINDSLNDCFSKLVLRGYKNEKVIISGGVEIAGWTKVKPHVFKTNVGNREFRQLYIDDAKAIRCREPNTCQYYLLKWNQDKLKYSTNTENFSKINIYDSDNPEELIVQRIWATQIFRLTGTTQNTDGTSFINILGEDDKVKQKPYLNVGDQYFHLENNIEFLDYDHEWFLDKKTGNLFVYLEDTLDDMNHKKVIVPELDNLMKITGKQNNPVQDITIQNLTFEYTNWILPDKIGLNITQAVIFYDYGTSQPNNGGIYVNNARNIIFKNNQVQNFGANGVMFYSNVKNSQITGNVIKNISCNGITIDWKWDLSDTLSTSNCSNIEVNNNLITKIGTDYSSAVGVFVGLGDSVIIEHNHLYDLPYTGISVGVGHTLKNTNLKNNKIRFNYLDHTMSLLSDGAAIYTMSNQPGTEINNNVIQNITRSFWSNQTFPVSGIYLDEGSNHISMFDNLFRNVDKRYHLNASAIGDMNVIIDDSKQGMRKTTENAGLQFEYLRFLKNNLTQSTCGTYNFSYDNANDIKLLIYPNPANEYLTLKNYELALADSMYYAIYSIQGQLVQKRYSPLTEGNLPYKIDIHELAEGIYIIMIRFDHFTGHAKFIKN